MAKKEGKANARNSQPNTRTWAAFATLFRILVETTGLTGAIFFCVFFFVVVYASAEQKRAIIDFYVLGKGFVGGPYAAIAITVVFGAIFIAQGYYYRGLIRGMQAELERLGQWKSEYQQGQTTEKLHHVRPKGGS